MPNCVTCQTLHNDKKEVPCEHLSFRPSAYGIIINDGKVLLMKMKSTGKYCLPGGGIELGEKNEEGLHREIKEETGLKVEIQEFLSFHEHFFYYDPLDKASHVLIFFYRCKPLTTELCAEEQVQDEEAETPSWVDINSISENDLQWMGKKTYSIIKKCL